MIIAAEFACYIQPFILDEPDRVNVHETTVIRGRVEAAAEAAKMVERARHIAKALGYPVVIKKVVCRWGSDRLPRGVRKLAGTEVANVL